MYSTILAISLPYKIRIMKTDTSKNKPKAIVQQMLDDKKVIREYIKKHGSLKGFGSDTIKLSRPF